jgi:uncharacterized membrane protein
MINLLKKTTRCFYGWMLLIYLYTIPGVVLGATTTKPGDDVKFSFSIESFLKFDDLEGLLVAILNILIVIAVPIIVLFIIYAGFLYVTARGNVQQIETANRAIVYAIIGAIMAIGALAIAEIIKNTIGGFTA